MKHIQALVEKGWILKVERTSDVYGDKFVARVDDPSPQLNVTSGHVHIGRTVETALLQLDDYVATEGKRGSNDVQG